VKLSRNVADLLVQQTLDQCVNVFVRGVGLCATGQTLANPVEAVVQGGALIRVEHGRLV